ncbi:MAG TPA: nuclear transport factor 2 family protein [Gemmatimonadales bacterium]|nr:nuclear transport factor 2 family protein [Gemmatimonadales bacterium]
MRRLPFSALLLVCVSGPVMAQTAADSLGIRTAALDYIEGYYAGDGDRMARALHPELVKRIRSVDGRGRVWIDEMGATKLVRITRTGAGTEVPAAEQKTDVRILDIHGNAASARIDAGAWVDYLHLVRWEGRWVILNVLWELSPPG